MLTTEEISAKSLKNCLNRVTKKYLKDDYFGYDQLTDNQVFHWEQCKKEGDKGALQYTEDQVRKFYDDLHKRELQRYVEMITAKSSDKTWLKANARYDQKFTLEVLEILLGIKLKGLSTKKIHNVLGL